MFKLKKKIEELEGRISALEAEMSVLFSVSVPEIQADKERLSYEEVIDIWLNGKSES